MALRWNKAQPEPCNKPCAMASCIPLADDEGWTPPTAEMNHLVSPPKRDRSSSFLQDCCKQHVGLVQLINSATALHTSQRNLMLTTETLMHPVLRLSHQQVFSAVSYLLKARSLLPALKRIQGTGKRETEIKASKLDAHSVPSLVYTV